jgi:hypothetical protein
VKKILSHIEQSSTLAESLSGDIPTHSKLASDSKALYLSPIVFKPDFGSKGWLILLQALRCDRRDSRQPGW